MFPRSKWGVPISEHSRPLRPTADQRVPNWEAVRLYLEIARRGSFRATAQHLKISLNVLRRRIDGLERQLAVRLFTRHVDGVRATAEGKWILEAAERMEVASFGLVRARDQVASKLSGTVKIAVTEGIGTFWIAPRLVEFQRAYPGLLIDIHCAMQSADVLRLEADAAIQLIPPAAADLKVVKLGRLHVIPFAASSYLETYGVPKNVPDVLKHRIVLLVAEQVTSDAEYNRLFPGVAQPGFVAMRTNVTSAHYWAIAKGAGIGMLPTYAHALGARIVPIDIGLHFQSDIWLTYHPDGNRIPRIRRLIDWLVESFNPRRFPWFQDEFIHPDDLTKTYRGAPLVNLFEGFISADQDRASNTSRK
jgi:DNA-binding transcriptional LysR family regulator